MLTSILSALGLGYVAISALLFVFQSHLVYLPQIGRDVAFTPRTVGLEFEDVWLEVEPGVRIHGWFVPRPGPKGAALIAHGNAGNIGLRIDWLRMFADLGYASLIVDYRGYGRSTGAPSEQGTYDDLHAAWRHLTEVRGFADTDIVLVGESLGGAVAAWLAARLPARALVLQSSFTSVPDLAADLYPVLPVRWLSRFRYDTRAALQQVEAPVLIAHSRDDEIVPFRHAEALFRAAREPKRLLELRGGHNDAFLFSRPEWTEALEAFLRAANPAGPRAQPASF